MPTTTNFSWNTPADTDLVKDGALAIRTLGNNIDTSLVDLKGGTTGQVLTKATNTDLDYTWTTPNVGDITEVQAGTGISVASGTGPIPVVTNDVATTYDAKGDLVVGTGADTFAKLTAGTNDFMLVADSAQSTGLKYAGTWTTWTPTYTNVTVGNGTVTARYFKVGKIVSFDFKIKFGSTTSLSGVPRFTLPSTSKSDVFFMDGTILDSGVANYLGAGQVIANTNEVYWKVFDSSGTYTLTGNVSATVPMTWTTNDEFFVHGFYEEA